MWGVPEAVSLSLVPGESLFGRLLPPPAFVPAAPFPVLEL